MKALQWLPLVLALAGCASATRPEHWPYQGSFLEVRNPTEAAQIIVARDGQGREWQVARIKAQGRACFRWPFIDRTGVLRTNGTERVVSSSFEPWTASRWSWDLTSDPVQDPSACH